MVIAIRVSSVDGIALAAALRSTADAGHQSASAGRLNNGQRLTTVQIILSRSGWPDLILGLGIAFMNADAAKEIYQLAREEHRATLP